MTSPRDNYLAWQAEIGTEDVVLAAPWVRPQGGHATRAAAHASMHGLTQVGHAANAQEYSSQDGPGGASPSLSSSSPRPAYTPPVVGPDFFNAIAEKLAKPDPMQGNRVKNAAAASKTSAASPAVSATAIAGSALPAHADLEAYWAWLEAEYPVWFPGVVLPLRRALGHASPRLAVVELSPTSEGLFAGEAGALLEKMMRAIGLTRDDLYMTSLMKTLPPRTGGKPWPRKDSARMVPALLRELKLAHCELVLLLGEPCAQSVLKTGRGLEALAGTAEQAEGMAFAATWHPADLLADETRKKPAWEQLKWLQTRLPSRGS
jgi:uracil-DNA glycosylase family 4